MDKFIPYEKLSKKKQREQDKKRRVTWGFSPVTRNAQNPKAYNRQKARKWNRDDFPTVPSAFPALFHDTSIAGITMGILSESGHGHTLPNSSTVR